MIWDLGSYLIGVATPFVILILLVLIVLFWGWVKRLLGDEE